MGRRSVETGPDLVEPLLLDRKGLEECACECYDIMRHDKLPSRPAIY
jgi:hypothetical protein